MMGIKEIIAKMKNFGEHDPHWEVDDDVTTDKSLRSLRRRRREQLEELEKEKLKHAIANHERFKTRRDVYGSEGYSLLGNKRKKAIVKKEILKQKAVFMSKYKL